MHLNDDGTRYLKSEVFYLHVNANKEGSVYIATVKTLFDL